jgi:hypothetical protein
MTPYVFLALTFGQVPGFPFPADAVGQKLRELGTPPRVVGAATILTPFRSSRDVVTPQADPTAATVRQRLLGPVQISVSPAPFVPHAIPDPDAERLRLRLKTPPPDTDPPVGVPSRP